MSLKHKNLRRNGKADLNGNLIGEYADVRSILANGMDNYGFLKSLGELPAVLTTVKDIGNQPTARVPLLTSAIALAVISTSVEDAAAGTGAELVELHLLDGDYNEVEIEIVPTGTTKVTLTGTYIAVNAFYVTLDNEVFDGTVNGGAIGTIKLVDDAGGTVVYSQINPTENTSHQAVLTIPAGKIGLLESVNPSITTAGAASTKGKVELEATCNFEGDTLLPNFVHHFSWDLADGSIPDTTHFRFPPKTIIRVGALKIGSGTTTATVNLLITLINEE